MNEHDVLERALQRMGRAPLELDEVYRRRARQHLRRRLAAGSTAIAVVALTVALFIRSLDVASQTSPVGTSASPGVTAPVTFSDFPSYVDLRGVAANDTGFVAIADTSTGNGADPVWFSNDGVSWTRTDGTGPDSGSLWGVIGDAAGFVTVGVDTNDDPAAWYSADGLDWTKATVDLPAHQDGADAMFGVAPNGDGYLAWGRIGTDTYLWRSTDGRTWTSIPDESVFGGDGEQFILWIDTSHPNALLAGGRDGQDQNGATVYASWSSADGGASWTKGSTMGTAAFETLQNQADVPSRSRATNELGTVVARSGALTFVPGGVATTTEAPPTTISSSSAPAGSESAVVYDHFPDWVDLRAIAANATGFVAVGDTSVGDNTDPVWFSADGTTWARVPKSSGPRASNLWDVIADANGFSAVGLDQNGTPAAWYSTDGLTWQRASVDLPGPSGDTNDMQGVVQIRDRYYGWGWVGSGDLDAYIWTSSDGRSWSSVPDESVFGGAGEQMISWIGQDTAGLYYAGGQANGGPALWRSGDGVTWEQIQVSNGDLGQVRQTLEIRDRRVATNRLGKARVGSAALGDARSSISFTPAGT